jgi:hypothetical protein
MMRYLALSIVLLAAVVGYVALLHRSSESDLAGERVYGAKDAKVNVYVEPMLINAASDSMQVRVSVSMAGALDGDQPAVSDQDYTILLGHDETIDRVEVRAHQPAPVITADIDLNDGDISSYPLDSYRAGLWVRVAETPTAPGSQSLSSPLHVTVWERVLGFRMHTQELPNGVLGGSRLGFEIHRGFAVTFFVLAAYSAMAVLGFGGLTIGILVFLRIRKPEATLTGALAGMVFALPALRNALPGGPPLGVSADIFVFLWSELMAVAAITLLIFTWARSGPRP